jgi:hypothetical protein
MEVVPVSTNELMPLSPPPLSPSLPPGAELIRPRSWASALGLIALLVGGCEATLNPPPARNVNLYQKWTLQPGDQLGGYRIQSGLGDVAVDLKGGKVFMPFDGEVQPAAGQEELCVIISSADVPAYLFRVCGLKQPRLGSLAQGSSLGSGGVVAFATLRRQADGTWAMVEPSEKLIAQFLAAP